MPTYGNAAWPYPNSTDAPDVAGAFLTLDQRLDAVSGAGVGSTANATTRAALVAGLPVYDGFMVEQLDTHAIWLYQSGTWVQVWSPTTQPGMVTLPVTSPTAGVTVSSTGMVTIPAGTTSPVLIDGIPTTYQNVDLTYKLVTSASVAVTLNLRTTAPATDTTTSYDYQNVAALNGTVSGNPSTSGTFWNTGVAATKHALVGRLIGLTVAEPTEFIFTNHDYNHLAGFTSQITAEGAGHHANTVMGGIAISWASGTAAGSVWIKGLVD